MRGRILSVSAIVIHKGCQKKRLTNRVLKRCNLTFLLEGYSYETHLPAFGGTPQTYPWLSRAHAHSRRSCRYSCASGQRPSSSRSLSDWIFATRVADRFGFPANKRLRQAGEFGTVFAQRRVLRGRLFNVHYRLNGGTSARLGLVIAKKLARRSVWRNAIKRTGREVFRLAFSQLPAVDMVLRLAKPVAAIDAVSRQSWRDEIVALLARLPR